MTRNRKKKQKPPVNKEHPWAKYLSYRKPKFLQKGVHYTCWTSSMAQQLRNAACKRHLRIKICTLDDGLIFTVVGRIPINKRR
jgi:hypothetical protein